jgi:hypothetical protein
MAQIAQIGQNIAALEYVVDGFAGNKQYQRNDLVNFGISSNVKTEVPRFIRSMNIAKESLYWNSRNEYKLERDDIPDKTGDKGFNKLCLEAKKNTSVVSFCSKLLQNPKYFLKVNTLKYRTYLDLMVLLVRHRMKFVGLYAS